LTADGVNFILVVFVAKNLCFASFAFLDKMTIEEQLILMTIADKK
jgi:hypothetical protein